MDKVRAIQIRIHVFWENAINNNKHTQLPANCKRRKCFVEYA